MQDLWKHNMVQACQDKPSTIQASKHSKRPAFSIIDILANGPSIVILMEASWRILNEEEEGIRPSHTKQCRIPRKEMKNWVVTYFQV